MSLPAKNAQQVIEKLLTTSTCTGPYCTGGDFPKNHSVPQIRILDGNGTTTSPPLSLPLADSDVAKIIQHGERAGIGLPHKTVVNLDIRKTWQLKPNKLSIRHFDKTLKNVLDKVSQELGTSTDYAVSAHLYKLLLYEPGCFFDPHRDNERLAGMFGTLIIELPSVYQGAELCIWSPLSPCEKKLYGGGQGDCSSMRYTAFYADCYHQVSKLMSGHRVALIYHLTAHPKVPKLLQHLPDPPALPAQPAEMQVIQNIADCMYTFAHNETMDDYPEPPRFPSYSKEELNSIKPSKFAIVLSHHYTPAGLKEAGLDALKGSDRAVGELIRAAAWCRPSQVPQDQSNNNAAAPYFDAVLSLAVIWKDGDGNCPGSCYNEEFESKIGPDGFRTTGPLIPLAGKIVPVPLLNMMGPASDGDLNAEYHPSWFADDNFYPSEELQYTDYRAFSAAIQAMVWPDRYGNHSLAISSREILFASEGARDEFRSQYGYDDFQLNRSAKEVEFLGNGMPTPGRCYSRSVILLWPKENREAVALQSKGGYDETTKKPSAAKKLKR